MFFWTNIPWNIFQSTGSLSIGAVLLIKKKMTEPNVVSCGTMEWIEWQLHRREQVTLTILQFLLGSKYLPCLWVKGRLVSVNVGWVHSASVSPASPTCRHLGLPQSSKPWSQDPVLLVGPALLTGLFPPRKWVKAYQKPLTNNFFF